MCVNISWDFIKEITEKSDFVFDGNILFVGGSGAGNYTNIQDAINDSVDGDTIFVYDGIYREKIEQESFLKNQKEYLDYLVKEQTCELQDSQAELEYRFLSKYCLILLISKLIAVLLVHILSKIVI